MTSKVQGSISAEGLHHRLFTTHKQFISIITFFNGEGEHRYETCNSKKIIKSSQMWKLWKKKDLGQGGEN